MSSSDNYKLHIAFKQQVFGMRLELVNGNLETVYDNIAHEADLQLPQGIYHLKISYLDYYQEKFFSISDDTDLVLDFNYPLTIPVLGYSTTHEYYSQDAEHYSNMCTGDEKPGPNFFFFAALHDMGKPANETPQQWLSYYSIFNIDKKEIQFTKENSAFEDAVGKLYFSVLLDPGLYFLRYKDGDNSRIFPLYIFEGFQTQFFIRYTLQPDFKNCRFFFSKENSFTGSGIEYFILEKILYAYSNFKNFQLISDDEIEIIKQQPYLVSLVNILFSAVNQTISGADPSINNISPVKDLPQLELPDISYCSNDPREIYRLSAKPPLLSFVIAKYTHQLNKDGLVFEPASILDRIVDNINYDLFWNNFSAIGEPDKWVKAYRPMLQSIDESSNVLIRSFTHAKNAVINYIIPQFDDNLKHLVGKLNLKEEQVNSLNEAIGKIKGVSEMSKEFGVPPTTILRNYDTYHNYFIQLQEPDPDKRVIPSQGKSRTTIIITLSGALALFLGFYFFWPQPEPDLGNNVIAVMTTDTKTDAIDMPVTVTYDTPAMEKPTMAAVEEFNNAALVKPVSKHKPEKTTARETQSLAQNKNNAVGGAERDADLILPSAPPPARPKTYIGDTRERMASVDNRENSVGSSTGSGNSGKEMTDKAGVNRDNYEKDKPYQERTVKEDKAFKEERPVKIKATVFPKTEPSKTKDSLSRYNTLVSLLEKSYSIEAKFKNGNYVYGSAKELLKINTDILELVKANPGYFTSNLTNSEINSLTGHLESWVADFKKKELAAGKHISPESNFTLNNHNPFPEQVRKKIDQAYRQLNERARN